MSSLLRHEIILQQRALVGSPSGETLETWEDAGRLRASFEPLKGREFFNQSSRASDFPQRSAQVDARIRVRFRQGLNPAEHRIVYGGVVYDLTAVIHDRRRGQTQLMVTASAAQQPDGSTVNA